MNYYKLLKSEKFLAMLAQAEKVNEVADKAAKRLGAKGYLNAIFADFGGLSAVEFGARKVVNKDVWDMAGKVGEHVFWEPKVEASEEAVMESELQSPPTPQGGEQEDETIIISKDAVSFQHIKALFTRKKCFEMAGMGVPSTGDPVDIAQKWLRRKLTVEEFKLMFTDMKTAEIFPHLNNASALMIISRGREENKEMLMALKDKKFRLVTHMKGHPDAVKIWKAWNELPVIPQGMVNALLGIEDGAHIAGFFVSDGVVYFQSGKKSVNKDAVKIGEEEWVNAREGTMRLVAPESES